MTASPFDRWNAGLYRSTHRKTRQLGGVGWATFQIADTAQRAIVDTAFDALLLRPAAAARVAGAAGDQAREVASLLPVGRSPRRPLAEIEGTYRVFALVSNVRPAVGLGPGPFSIVDAVARADRLGFYALWAVEGLGHDYAAECWKASAGALTGLLRDARLDRRRLNMLHAGLGLFMAEQLLGEVTPYSAAEDVMTAVDEFVDRCTRNAVSGCEGPAFESLGLVTRTWFPEMVGPLTAVLPRDLAGYFWHGAGRALAFLPIHAVPGLRSPWVAAAHEARGAESALNLRAGLAWATVLVNVPRPAVLESVIRAHGDEFEADGAFAAGVRTAIAMAAETSPDDGSLEAFVAHAPGDGSLAAAWDVLVRQPARDGLALTRRGGGLPGRAFKYRFAWEATA